MQPRTQASARPDAGANVCEVLHRDARHRLPYRFRHNRLARLVVDVLHAPPLPTGDLPEPLSCALAAVGLKTATRGKVARRADGAKPAPPKTLPVLVAASVFSPTSRTITGPDVTACGSSRLDDQVEEPFAIAKDEFRFLRLSRIKNAALVFSEPHRDPGPAREGIEARPNRPLSSVRALVVVDARPVEAVAGTGASFLIRPSALCAL